MATRRDQSEKGSSRDIDSIIESYGQHADETEHKDSEVSKERSQAQRKYRDFEKETARKCFKKPSDWENKEKISDFLKKSARKDQK